MDKKRIECLNADENHLPISYDKFFGKKPFYLKLTGSCYKCFETRWKKYLSANPMSEFPVSLEERRNLYWIAENDLRIFGIHPQMSECLRSHGGRYLQSHVDTLRNFIYSLRSD